MKRWMQRMVWMLVLAVPALAEPDVEALIKRMPTKSHVESDAICAELLGGGAAALDRVCAKITPTTADDVAARFTVGALVHYSARPGADNERRAVAETLVRAMQAATDDAIRAFMIEQLQWVGNDTHAAAVAPHLRSERLCSDALRTIQLIGGDTREALLTNAVTAAAPACQALIVKALGDMASDAAVTPAMELLKRDEPAARAAAHYAIARTGDLRQLTLMQTLRQTEPDTYLIYLARLVEQGHATEAATESQALVADPQLTSAFRSKALGTLVAAQGNQALPTLSDVVVTEDPALRNSAIRLLTALQGAEVETALMNRLMTAEGKALAPWLLVLAGRGIEPVRATAVKALAHPEAEVQQAAVEALSMLGGDASVAPLLATAGAGGATAKAAALALVGLKGEQVNTRLADALAGPAVATQLAALAALTSRGAREHMAALWPLLEQADSSLRMTTLHSMERLAAPADRERLLAFLAHASDGSERSAAGRTVLAITQGMTESPERMAPIRAALHAGDDALKQELIKILPAFGGAEALQMAVDSSSGSSREEVRTVATRALTSWRDPAAVPPLLAIAENDQMETHRILALRAIARLLAMGQGSVEERVAHYGSALRLAERDEERQTLVGGLAKIGDASKWTGAPFVPLFNGKDLTGWQGNVTNNSVAGGLIVAQQGHLFTEKTYGNFILTFQFKLTPGANNGIAIRWPGRGDPAYTGFEIQVLDDTAAKHAALKPYQYHGSIYSLSPAKRGFLKKVGEWNDETIIAKGDVITVILNGETIIDAVDVSAAKRPESGYIGFCGHGDEVMYRNLRIKEIHNVPPRGFAALWNGRDLEGWWGLGTEHYKTYRDLLPEAFKAHQATSRKDIRKHWRVEGDDLVNDGTGLYLSTDRFYGDFELVLDYKTVAQADSGIYLRGIPQVQIWDTTQAGGKWNLGADKGSGGLWNNPSGAPGKDPLVLADKPFSEWNHFRVVMKGSRVSVWLNDQHVVDDAELSNYFDRKSPIPPDGPIQLQTHGGQIRWRNVFIRELASNQE